MTNTLQRITHLAKTAFLRVRGFKTAEELGMSADYARNAQKATETRAPQYTELK